MATKGNGTTSAPTVSNAATAIATVIGHQRWPRAKRWGEGVERGTSARLGTLDSTVFTLVVCLVVVAFSGAAVLHIVLSDSPQRATLRGPPRREPPFEDAPRSSEAPDLGSDEIEPVRHEVPTAHERSPSPHPAPSLSVANEPPEAEPPPKAPPLDRPPPIDLPPGVRSVGWLATDEVPETSRLRSAALLVALLTTVGGLLAIAVVVVLALSAVALRGALR